MTFDFPPHNATDTSTDAAASVVTYTPSLRERVRRTISLCNGSTSDEVEALLGLSHQTISARIWELRKQGLIADSGERRKTRSGRNAIVWGVI